MPENTNTPIRDFYEQYLKRLGLNKLPKANQQTLFDLHKAHLCNIPFENFDIQAGLPVILSSRSMYEKLLTADRGGYCFELNGLFLDALRSFGYTIRPLLARVHLSGEPGARTHLTGLCSLSGRQWLVDVGFGGGGLRYPMPFEPGRIEQQDKDTFRIIETDDYGYMLQQQKQAEWINLYSFDLTIVNPSDIQMGNFYCSTHPDSLFVGNRIATIATPEGRISLLNYDMKITSDANEQMIKLDSDPSYLKSLELYFNIRLPWNYTILKPVSEIPQ